MNANRRYINFDLDNKEESRGRHQKGKQIYSKVDDDEEFDLKNKDKKLKS